MAKIYIVANLKSYKNLTEAKEWLDNFKKIKETEANLTDKEIIICPPFQLLFTFSSYIHDNNIPVKLGAQNLSPFDEGAYTGEVNAQQLKDFAEYVIIGHSERRKYFNESDNMLKNKTSLALKYNLTPIFCVQNKDTYVPEGVSIIAYEPVFAIGSGNPDTPENANETAQSFKDKSGDYSVLYGGSVTFENVANFTKMQQIKGILVGGASLDPQEFIKIIQNA